MEKGKNMTTGLKYSMENFFLSCDTNDFGVENYDALRFGSWAPESKQRASLLDILKIAVKDIIGLSSRQRHARMMRQVDVYTPFMERLERIWKNLSGTDRELLVSLLAYRLMGYQKVRLERNNDEYWNALSLAETLKVSGETYDPHFLHFILNKMDLNPLGIDCKFFFSPGGVAIDFILEQYAYKLKNEPLVHVEEGDVVFDVGGCWGDTALYFANKTGPNGKIYSFEFIPDNLKLFKMNTGLNPYLESRIELIENPVSNRSGTKIFYKDFGPGSRIEMSPFAEQTGETETVCIDDIVNQKNIQKLDFIKMDIEGAEPMALEGAIKTIRRFKPKLAIAIYHSMDDFVNIPNWILDLDMGYKIFLSHSTIHAEETVCFAKVIE